jgi:hypothetical protein
LLKLQPYIKNVVCEKEVDFKTYNAIDLGQFRNGRVNILTGDITQRYNFINRQLKYFNIYDSWLKLPKTILNYDHFKNKIVVFRTNRYRNSKINY